MRNNPIVSANVWVIHQRENLGLDPINTWNPVSIDLTKVSAIESNGESEGDFIEDNMAVVHFDNGRTFTLDISFDEINERFLKVKKELYACD